jgi:hypothetical protein
VPYFLANGISRPQLLDFLRIAQSMIVRSFDEATPDYTREQGQLKAVFAEPAVACA